MVNITKASLSIDKHFVQDLIALCAVTQDSSAQEYWQVRFSQHYQIYRLIFWSQEESNFYNWEIYVRVLNFQNL